jgi:hypothetical protein
MKNILLLSTLIFLSISNIGFSQNDECSTALNLGLITSYCSGSAKFDNSTATPSSDATVLCNNLINTDGDIWFTFRLDKLSANIRVLGRGEGVGNTLSNPAVSVYRGSCRSLSLIGCNSSTGSNFAELVISNLRPAEQLFMRISGKLGSKGKFELCIDGIVLDRIAESDCSRAQILCDKDPFVVPVLAGTGNVQDEADNTCLDNFNRVVGGENSEAGGSAWYKWKCKDAGTLTFTLTPFGNTQDLDFAVFLLPGGENDCNNKRIWRCMASGETQGQSAEQNARCLGPTGLSLSSSDNVETSGCSPGDDNFVASITMAKGEVYALVVNNFSNDGKGFSIKFGGTGTFEGPDFTFGVEDVSVLECDKKAKFTSKITAGIDSIVTYKWDFGENADIVTLNGAGPHEISYARWGEQSAALTVTSKKGCTSTKIIDLFIQPCCRDTGSVKLNNNLVKELACTGDSNAIFNVNANGGIGPRYLYSLDSIKFGSLNTFTNLRAGTYTVYAADEKGCFGKSIVTINDPPPLKVSAGPDQEVDLGKQTTISGTLDPPNLKFKWITSSEGCTDYKIDSNRLTQTFFPLGQTRLILEGKDSKDCVARDTLFIKVNTEYFINSPNIISVNSTNPVNQIFSLKGGQNFNKIMDLSIYDRWGNKVFYSIDPEVNNNGSGWNGVYQKKVVPGVYVWVARVEFLDCKIITMKGDVTVVE